MSEWILESTCKPPTCHQVLVYVIYYHETDLINICDDAIYSAFYDDEVEAWFLDEPNSTRGNVWKKIENETTKVLAWTLTPSIPDIKIIKERHGK